VNCFNVTRLINDIFKNPPVHFMISSIFWLTVPLKSSNHYNFVYSLFYTFITEKNNNPILKFPKYQGLCENSWMIH